MVNEVREVENSKNTTAKSAEDNVSFLSVMSDLGKSAAIGCASGLAGVAISEACKAANGTDSAAKTAMKAGAAVAEAAAFGVAPLAITAGKEVAKYGHAAAQGAKAGIEAGANAVLGEKTCHDIKDVAKEVATGAVIGGVVGACAGDATRAVALATVGGIAAGARKVLEDCCCKSKTLTPVEAGKQLLSDTWNHMKNRPLEAAAEGLLLGPAGIMAGAAIHKMMEQKDCCNPKEMSKRLNEKIDDRNDTIKEILKSPFILPVLSPVGGSEIIKRAAKAAGTGQMIDVNAAKETAVQATESINNALDQHRKANPVASQAERTAGYIIGGPIGGKMVGTALELQDVGYRKAYDYVKSWFK